jgi:hypothetical protein
MVAQLSNYRNGVCGCEDDELLRCSLDLVSSDAARAALDSGTSLPHCFSDASGRFLIEAEGIVPNDEKARG